MSEFTATKLLQRDNQVFEVQFTPDGQGMIFREGNATTGDADLGFLELETGDIDEGLLASEFNERAIALSPDGGWLAYVSDVTGEDQVFVRPFPSTGSGRLQVSTNGGLEPVWARGGGELFYRGPESDQLMSATYTTDPTFEVTGRTPLFDASDYVLGEGASWHSYDVSPDGQRFVFMKPGGGLDEDGEDPARIIQIQNWFTELRERLEPR